MGEDKLTHAERVRLEAFAQAGGRYPRGISLEQQFKDALEIEQFILDAGKDSGDAHN